MNYVISISFLFYFSLQGITQKIEHDFSSAIEIAQENDKHVLMIFSGSDWCKPCIQLKSNIIQSEEFISYSKDHFVLLELDFPYKKNNGLSKAQKKHNESLAELYNIEGSFPKLVLLNKYREIQGQLSYKKDDTPQSFIDRLHSRIETN